MHTKSSSPHTGVRLKDVQHSVNQESYPKEAMLSYTITGSRSIQPVPTSQRLCLFRRGGNFSPHPSSRTKNISNDYILTVYIIGRTRRSRRRTYPETSSHTTCQGTFGQSSQLAEPLWTDPGIKSGISVRELISSLKKKKKRRRGMNGRTFSRIPRKRGKSHHHFTVCALLDHLHVHSTHVRYTRYYRFHARSSIIDGLTDGVMKLPLKKLCSNHGHICAYF